VCLARFLDSAIGLKGRVTMDEFDQLEQIINEGKQDWLKWKGGNKAAGTRVRKVMQDLKAQAQVVREKILEIREDTDKKG
jgi:hypothetical protein